MCDPITAAVAGDAITGGAIFGGTDAAIGAVSAGLGTAAAADTAAVLGGALDAGASAAAAGGAAEGGLTADQFAAGLTPDQIAGTTVSGAAGDAAAATPGLGVGDVARGVPGAGFPVPDVAPPPIVNPPITTTTTGAVVPGAPALSGGAAPIGAGAPSAAAAPAPAALTGVSPDLTAGGDLNLADTAAAVGGGPPSSIAGIGPSNIATTAITGPTTGPTAQDLGIFNPGQTAATALPATQPPTPGFIDKALSKAGDFATSPGAVVGALGLGYQALTQPKMPKGAQAPAVTADQLALANQATAGAAALESPLTTGVLPPGAQAAIDNATKAAKARVISNYAARGMDTDPKTNASLAQELNGIDQQAAGQVFQFADQLYQQGLSQAQISAELYNAILSNTTAQNKTMSDAISNFVTAAAGGGARPTIQIGGTSASAG